MKQLLSTLALFALICLSNSCSRETDLSGEVFIVTQGAGNYKLGLVQVGLIPENDVRPFVASMSNDAEVAQLKTEWDAAIARAKSASDHAAELEAMLSAYKASADAALRSGDLETLQRAQLTLNDWKAKGVEYESAYRTKAAAIDAAARALMKLNDAAGAARYFTALPKPTFTATTDSDGKFSLKIPVKGRYAIAATSSRKVGDEDETYYWLIWLEADGTVKKIMLSNNNTTDSGSPESVIKTTTYAPK